MYLESEVRMSVVLEGVIPRRQRRVGPEGRTDTDSEGAETQSPERILYEVWPPGADEGRRMAVVAIIAASLDAAPDVVSC
jgi:hypothetical protein